MKLKPAARRIFAENLRKARQTKKLSQEDLAELASLHRTYNMERLAAAVGLKLASLLQEAKQ